ncbi:unnamed protein product [Vitrella brassicaformis CCMP3155]|uniref:Uncharacterized protein n=1 Tax=Vitrella brassicaformis (strain CCMP3155) TaxID=1169540 RepID=A0A0G4ETT6_VITBC|nr:unnamed protein product [Vitrella brassicaformis CCMP3155]|eukprot:CEM01473.1 unnamed protein product [Vitrella brassicaformis CCMP3155]
MGAAAGTVKSNDEASPAINGQVLDFIHRDGRDELHEDVKDLGSMRNAPRFFGNDHFPAQALRGRLDRSLNRIRLADGTRLAAVLAFDTQTVVGAQLLLAAIWMVEEQRWDEVAEVLQWASQCGNCTLPVNLTADDIRTHVSKTAYSSVARVLAQLMVVGRHVQFGDGSRLQLFRRGDEVRAIKDEPGFRLAINPPFPAKHLYQQHRQPHDPPVQSRSICYEDDTNQWVSSLSTTTWASVSSYAKAMILNHFINTEQTSRLSTALNRYVGGSRLQDLLTQSPHTPVAGCTTTFRRIGDRWLVLTNNSHHFVACVDIWDLGAFNVHIVVHTTESAVAGVGEDAPFKDRFPVTTQLAHVALAAVAPLVFDVQPQQQLQPQQQPQHQGGDDDGNGDEGDDMDDGNGGEGSGGEDAAAEEGNGGGGGEDSASP